MKYINSLIFILFALPTFAQVTLTSSVHGFIPGTTQFDYTADTTGYTSGGSGAAQTWDFSGLNIFDIYSTTTYLDSSSASYDTTFSMSTVASSNDGASSDYYYFTQTSADLILNGESFLLDSELIYSDPERILKFPFAFGDTLFDDFGNPSHRTGSISVNADAYGTLILPSGIYTTLRVKSREQSTDYLAYTIKHDIVTYSWYTATERFPILQYTDWIEYDYFSSPMVTPFAFYSKMITVNSSAVGINEASVDDHFLNVYPNPANDACTLNFDLKKSAIVTIFLTDIVGKNVMTLNKGTQSPGFKSETINLNGIAAGMYILKVNYGNNVAYKKVQVK